ncbi:FUSC family protein [Rhodospira trueperi]|uniref:Fusaric acid resistance protein-like n=1 Tax=Rhodospira trueperi TaxID=69960 RepID=A0A1G6YKM0_9PROT|nr:FUSC family protein [Rhodospira trueperi]SDD90185.1 Fusaric acid resistance protein-like [Rhodospira trueperi]
MFQRLKTTLINEARTFAQIRTADRPWHMPVAAALATGAPMLTGAWFGHVEFGQASALGGLVLIYLPPTPLSHRMLVLMACAFSLTACFTLGVISHFFPPVMMPALCFIAIMALMVARFYGLGMPGALFFVMAASIGAYLPLEVIEVPLYVGLVSMGCLLSCIIGFAYSLYDLRTRAPKPVPPRPDPTFDFIIVEPVIIGAFVGLALVLAQILDMEKAYWVPVSCLAVIQGASSLRAVWERQLHRLVGTALGVLLAGVILLVPLTPWTLALIMMALSFAIETIVVRHYAFAVVFVTPLTILLADAAHLDETGAAGALMSARFLDTVLGCLVGLAGGVCLHNSGVRDRVRRALRRLIPARLADGGAA